MSVESNADAIRKRAGVLPRRLENVVVPGVMRSQAPKERKYIRLVEIAEKAMEVVSPNTPCRKNCSHCCYMATPISLTDAKVLSEYSGRPYTKVPYLPSIVDPLGTNQRLNQNTDKFERKPCPFLGTEGECTVYEVRPMPCRLHHVIDDNPEPCDLFSGRMGAHQVDVHWIQYASTTLEMDQPFADIREFFPEQKT